MWLFESCVDEKAREHLHPGAFESSDKASVKRHTLTIHYASIYTFEWLRPPSFKELRLKSNKKSYNDHNGCFIQEETLKKICVEILNH